MTRLEVIRERYAHALLRNEGRGMKTATSFKPGQARPPNAGRKKGTPNKARALLLDIATKELGVEPIVEMSEALLADVRLLLACVDEMRGALNAIACWDDGDVGFHMDEPASAQHARETLASIEEKLR